MTKEQYIELLKKPYPNTLEECLLILEKIKYKALGFPMAFLTYDYSIKQEWHVAFRNPSNFDNKWDGDKSPIKACHNAFNYLHDSLSGKMKRVTINRRVVMSRDKYYWFKVGKINLNISFDFITREIEEENRYVFLAPFWWVDKMKKEGKIEHFNMIIEDS